jgi:hypothetical protein
VFTDLDETSNFVNQYPCCSLWYFSFCLSCLAFQYTLYVVLLVLYVNSALILYAAGLLDTFGQISYINYISKRSVLKACEKCVTIGTHLVNNTIILTCLS